MAHAIDQTKDQRGSAMYAGSGAWHKLGTVVKDCQTSREAIKLAGLDWNVEQWDLTAQKPVDSDAETIVRTSVQSHVANIRTDTSAVLGVVSPNYEVFQNQTAFAFMDWIVGDKLAMYETCGSLHGGKCIWILARLPKEVRVTSEDYVKPYLLLRNRHDGRGFLRMLGTTVRVVCDNTLNYALSWGGRNEGIAIPHRGNLEAQVKAAREALGVAVKQIDRFSEQVLTLRRKQMSGDELRDYFTSLVAERSEKSQKRMLDAFLENFDNERQTLKGVKGSAWAAYNAVSEWSDHTRQARGEGDVRLSNRLNSNWFGASADFKVDAFDKALTLAS